MVDAVLDLEEEIQELIDTFEKENKVAVTALSLNRQNQTEDYIGDPLVKLHLVVPYSIER